MKITTVDVTPDSWKYIEELFGSNGACGGCWCMSWRIAKDEKWDRIKGTEAKKRFKKLITSGKAHGALAFSGDEVIGWCSFDKRIDYLKLDRAPSLKCDDAENVWSIPCFFIKKGFRGKGVAAALLKHSVKTLKQQGIKIVEGYPVKLDKELPAAFVWTGTLSLFEKEGFEVVTNKKGKQRVRKVFS
ncbi:MAG: GNAT family N-acetyltransferase [Ignavibacteriaceae bacterium]|jgi:predicted GNAT family acetyltransferase|nr:GNAT family N-acetyltransferase [Ignavibacteriaceae bacterium]